MLDGCCYFLLGLGCHCRLAPYSLGPGDEGMGLLDLVGLGLQKLLAVRSVQTQGTAPGSGQETLFAVGCRA